MDKPRLLYIEDNDDQRRSLTKLLRSRGFTVTPSKSGATGFDFFKKRRFDIILCDLNMPGMGGEKVLEKVRRLNGDIPFILLSAHGTVSLAIKAIKKGADDFILKPAEINVIAITLKKAVEKRKLEKQLRDSEAKLRIVTENVPDFIYALDLNGVFLSLSASPENTLEYSPGELIGTSIFNVIHPDDREAVLENFHRSLAAHETGVQTITFRMVSKSGKVRQFEIKRRHIYENKQCVQSVGIARDVTEQHEAEEKIKLYRELFINANDGIAIFDSAGYFMERNAMHLEKLGFREDFSGKKFSELLGARGPEIEKTVFDKGEFRGEITVAGPDGSATTIDLSIFRIKKESGEALGYAGIARDITQRKKAEEQIANRLRYEEGLAALSQSLLKESEADDALDHALKHLLNAARVGRVYIFENFMDEVDGLCMRQTHEVCVPGVEPQIDNPLLQHAPYKEGFDEWRKLLESGESVGGLIKDLSGSERAVFEAQEILSILVIPITVAGHWYGFIGFDDVREEREWNKEDVRTLRTAAEIIGSYIQHQQFEESLRFSEERFRGLVENANDIIYALSPEGVFTYVSPKVTDILGYEVEEVLGKPLFPFMHPDDREESIKWWQSGMECHAEHAAGYEFRQFHKDGSIRWFTTNASPILDEDGNIMMLIGVSHDITEPKRILKELQEANRHLKETQIQLVQSEKMASLGQLVAGIAHEINTPIGALSSMHDTLMRAMDKLKAVIDETCPRGAIDQSEMDATLKIIDDSNKVIKSGAERVITIVRRLRSFARLDEAELKTVDIHEGLEDTLTLIHHEIKHDITVVKNYGNIPSVACYPGQLNQVFLNVLINAKQAINGKGEITITTFIEDNNIYIAIKDTGPGISQENLGRVFDPGFTTKGVGVGTGLGLSICYKIMQVHRGGITVESEPGRGTTFTLHFPMNLELMLEENVDNK